ncbi:MAG: 2-deoxy-scyllo-inosose synthase [bacterium]
MNVSLKNIRQYVLTRTSGANPVSLNSVELKRTNELRSEIIFGRNSLFNNSWLASLLHQKESQHFIITDNKVGDLYAAKVSDFLCKHAVNFDVFTIPIGEKSKSLRVFENLSSDIIGAGMDKNSYIIGLGGGVVNNIAGFLASTLYRGVNLIQIPTSLLAQVDAAIDFKQAINGPGGKNHIGSYYPAEKIIIDPEVLCTLSHRQLKNGLAESIKHALTQDWGFCDYLLKYTGNIDEPSFLDNVIVRTVDLKIMLLNESLNHDYAEMLPQYGHAIGHALEKVSDYKLLHGEAIAIGMCVTAEIALLLGVCDESTVIDHYKVMRKFGLPMQIPNYIPIDELLAAIRRDKHFCHGEMKSVLVSRVGSIGHSHGNECVFSIRDDLIKSAVIKNCSRNVTKRISCAR